MTTQLSNEQRLAVSRISGLVVVNAMIFQEVLAGSDKRVLPLKKVLAQSDPIDAFAQHWEFIYREIDYYPIFHLARQILLGLTANADMLSAIHALADTARGIITNRAALRHDLMGRIYHRLLVEAKYLGTYYTSIPSAVILLKLALRPSAWDVNWRDIEDIASLRISDLACGTGTLLMAAADVIADNYVSAATSEGVKVDLSELQRRLVEDVLYGYDVLPSALHLTASTLALRAPEISFSQMHLVNMPLGGPESRLGSLDFLRGERAHQTVMISDLFGAYSTAQTISSTQIEESQSIDPVPPLDLCIMNPPFVRSVGGNLLFGSSPPAERAEMQKLLKKVVAKAEKPYRGKYANITAGLGSIFVFMADHFLRPGSRIGLVLPKALLSGVAWKETRQLLQRSYRLEYVVASHDPERWNFSESTSLSEVLVVAVKREPGQKTTDKPVVGVNLWRNPTTAFEALAVAHELLGGETPSIHAEQGTQEIVLGGQKIGEAIAFPWEDETPASLLRMSEWMLPNAFAQAELIRTAYALLQGKLRLPGLPETWDVPLCPLDTLGVLGPDRRDIHDGFSLSQSPTAYPALWGHDSKQIRTIAQEVNKYLSPLAQSKPGRNLRKTAALWPLAGKVLIVERMRLNTSALVAVRLERDVLSNVWWTFKFDDDNQNENKSGKVLALWLNSTLSSIIFLVNREETEGAWIDFKKPILSRMPVIDLTKLSKETIDFLAGQYDRLAHEPLLPLRLAGQDQTRTAIDDAVRTALDLPDFSVLRELVSREPVVCLERL